MNGWKSWSLLSTLVLAAGCGEGAKPYFATGGSIVTGDDTSTPTPDDPPDDDPPDDDPPDDEPPPDDTAPMDDTGGEGDEAFDNPGDTRKMEQDDDGGLKMDMSDASGDNNQEQEFYLVLVNTGSDEATYTLRYIPTVEEDEEETEGDGGGEPDEGPPPDEGGEPDEGPPPDEGGEPDEGPPPDEGGGAPPPAYMPSLSIKTPTGTHVSPAKLSAKAEAKAAAMKTALTGFGSSSASPVPPPSEVALDDTDVGLARRVFRVRRDMNDSTECEVIDATLWALGDYAAIWVDGDVPINEYNDCTDTEACEEAESCYEESEYDAHGFDNCDLETIVNIVDTNIMPNVTGLLGDTSDEDSDGRVSIVISPVLNAISMTSDDEDDWETLVEAYTDPETDLGDFSSEENPCSDEQEVIYVYAPDPYGHFNPFATVTVDEYTGMDLAGRIVQGMVELISYNQHVLVNESDAEESWVTKGIAAVVADLVGFGAIYYDDAWDYMDAPHLAALTDGEEESAECGDDEEGGGDADGGPEGGDEPPDDGGGDGGPPPSKSKSGEDDSIISTEKRGAQYLFFRWLVDTYGEDILASLVQTENVGLCNIEDATEAELKDLAVAWQVALLTTGKTNMEGNDLVDTSEWDLYRSPSLLSAPIIDPEPGDNYGANGYQSGIDVAGTNLYMDGGTTEEATEIEENAVVLGNTDHFTFVAAIPFNAAVAGAYGAHVVRVTDIPYETATLEVQSSSADLKGVLIRWNDPERVDYKVENIFSATDANNMTLPSLLDDGSEITALGTISEAGVTLMVSDEGDMATDVYDTDRWLLDLTDRDSDEEITVAITVDRRYDNEGDMAPYDLWAAVVPAGLLPSPSVDGTRRGDCDEGVDFGYPASMLDYLYYQMFLSSDPGTSGVTADFDPCGSIQAPDTGSTDTAWEGPTCGSDWDRDEVLDLDEPRPSNLLEQVMVMQCALAGGDFSGVEPYEAEDIIDSDTLDENDNPYVDRTRNLGGKSGDSEEEAYLETTLAGGARYVIVVGAGTETGTYELRVKEID